MALSYRAGGLDWASESMTGTASAPTGRNGMLHGRIQIQGGDEHTFMVHRASKPTRPIANVPHDRHKYGPMRWRPGTLPASSVTGR